MTSAILVIFTSCATPSKFTPERERLYFWNPSAQSAIEKNSDKAADRLFKFYCRDGKQAVPIKKRVRAVLGRTPKGIPLDRASELRAAQKRKIEQAIEGLFSVNGHIFRDYGQPQLKMRTAPVWTEAASFDELIKMVKSVPVSCRDSLNCHGPTFVDTGHEILVFLSGVPTSMNQDSLETIPFGDYFISFDFQNPSVRPCRPSDSKCDAGVRIFESINLILPEPPLFTSQFVLMMTREELHKMFGQELEKIGRGVAGADYLYGAEGQDSIANLVKYSPAIWSAFLSQQTSLSEAQLSDPQEVAYEVSLDVAPFCQNGRRLEDLKSK